MKEVPEGERARAAALRILKFRPRSEGELRRRLADKGFGAGTVEAAMAGLRRQGLVDDAQFARLFVAQQMHARPVGRRLLVSRLRAKGVQPELASAAVALEASGQDELEVARRLASKREPSLRGLPRETAQRRLFGFLSRRGFSSDVVYKVVREMTVRSEPVEE